MCAVLYQTVLLKYFLFHCESVTVSYKWHYVQTICADHTLHYCIESRQFQFFRCCLLLAAAVVVVSGIMCPQAKKGGRVIYGCGVCRINVHKKELSLSLHLPRKVVQYNVVRIHGKEGKLMGPKCVICRV